MKKCDSIFYGHLRTDLEILIVLSIHDLKLKRLSVKNCSEKLIIFHVLYHFYLRFYSPFISGLLYRSIADHNRSMHSRKTTSESDTTLLKAGQPHTALKVRKPKPRKILNTPTQKQEKRGQKSRPTGRSEDIYFNLSSYSCKDRSTHKQPSTQTLIYLALYGPNVSSSVWKQEEISSTVISPVLTATRNHVWARES